MKRKILISGMLALLIILVDSTVHAAENNMFSGNLQSLSLTSSETVTQVETWDISKTEEDNVSATLYSDGKLVISGTGKMKNWNSRK